VPASASPSLLRHRIAVRRALLRWFRTHRRALPWRETPSLYGTVVSEFMLQQTQVKTVLPYFARWLVQFPDFAALAAAPEATVVKAWEGLGYYSRARNLHRLAQAVAARPAPPRTAVEWQELPGVGPYTGAAIASIGCGDPAACVDGNVVRVLARLTATARSFPAGGAAVKHFGPLAIELLDTKHPGAFNEAMMELGATVCLPRAPRCADCPLARWCRGKAAGNPERFPQIARKKTERRLVWRVWCERKGTLLLHRANVKSRRLAGLCELPTAGQLGIDEETLRPKPTLLVRCRGITHHLIEERIVAVEATAFPSPTDAGELVWVPLAELESTTFSGPHRRWVREILAAHLKRA